MVTQFRGTRADVVAAAHELAGMLTGRVRDTSGIARGFLLAIGSAALSDIKEAYIVKALGGTDEMGIKWPPLSPITIAMRRKTRKERKLTFTQLAQRKVKILRDTGILFNSLSPGILTKTGYRKPKKKGGSEQIMDVSAGQVIVGTNVAYADTHQNGSPSRKIPARPFLPRSQSDVPRIWWDRWANVAKDALRLSIAALFKRGRR